MKEKPQDSSEMSESDFMKTFLARNHPPKEAVEHFRAIPWLNNHLSSEKYKIIPTFSRHLKTSGEDYFFSRTINTPTTIPHMVSVQLRDFVTVKPSEKAAIKSSKDHTTKTEVPEFPDALCLISLGKQGLDGHPATIHGGVTCAIMDETMGLLMMLHENNISGPGPRDSLFTANLNVSYRAPVKTPADVLVKTWLVARQGRKWFSKGQLVDKEGTVLAEADGLWVTAKREKL